MRLQYILFLFKTILFLPILVYGHKYSPRNTNFNATEYDTFFLLTTRLLKNVTLQLSELSIDIEFQEYPIILQKNKIVNQVQASTRKRITQIQDFLKKYIDDHDEIMDTSECVVKADSQLTELLINLQGDKDPCFKQELNIASNMTSTLKKMVRNATKNVQKFPNRLKECLMLPNDDKFKCCSQIHANILQFKNDILDFIIGKVVHNAMYVNELASNLNACGLSELQHIHSETMLLITRLNLCMKSIVAKHRGAVMEIIKDMKKNTDNGKLVLLPMNVAGKLSDYSHEN